MWRRQTCGLKVEMTFCLIGFGYKENIGIICSSGEKDQAQLDVMCLFVLAKEGVQFW